MITNLYFKYSSHHLKPFSTVLSIIITTSVSTVSSQTIHNTGLIRDNTSHFIDIYVGAQASGIRKEDYVASNYSPYLQMAAGKSISPAISLGVGLQGFYFNYIEDNDKHPYAYLDAVLMLKPIRLIRPNNSTFYELYLIGGPGYMYNHYYKRSNLCLTGGVVNEFHLKNSYSLKLKVAGIAGWKIYQHDMDMLTNLSIGLSKRLHKEKMRE